MKYIFHKPFNRDGQRSPPARVVWIEIFKAGLYQIYGYVATREGGVD